MHRVIVVFLVGLSSVMAMETNLVLYRPYAVIPTQAPITITSHQKGLCNRPSQRTMREDAWQCNATNGAVIDPCFAKSYGSLEQVICPPSPWNGMAIELTLTKPLTPTRSSALDMSRHDPWALELINGNRCQRLPPNAEEIRYQCDHDVQLIGEIQRCTPEWKIGAHTPQGVSVVVIKTAWF